VVLATVTWLLVGRALRPVEVLRRQAADVTATDLHRRLDVPPSRDELGRLATTLNDLLARLESSTRRQREFVADAAHELRTPLASPRTQLEVAAGDPDPQLTVTLVVSADAISGERERGTLESLLLAPIGRRAIVAGKLAGNEDWRRSGGGRREKRRRRPNPALMIDRPDSAGGSWARHRRSRNGSPPQPDLQRRLEQRRGSSEESQKTSRMTMTG
jgi:signal transduction histidine kinase